MYAEKKLGADILKEAIKKSGKTSDLLLENSIRR
jgi:hypothetical protein